MFSDSLTPKQKFIPEVNWLIHRLVFAASIFFVISNGALLLASLSDNDDNAAYTIISDVSVAVLILISCVLVVVWKGAV